MNTHELCQHFGPDLIHAMLVGLRILINETRYRMDVPEVSEEDFTNVIAEILTTLEESREKQIKDTGRIINVPHA